MQPRKRKPGTSPHRCSRPVIEQILIVPLQDLLKAEPLEVGPRLFLKSRSRKVPSSRISCLFRGISEIRGSSADAPTLVRPRVLRHGKIRTLRTGSDLGHLRFHPRYDIFNGQAILVSQIIDVGGVLDKLIRPAHHQHRRSHPLFVE